MNGRILKIGVSAMAVLVTAVIVTAVVLPREAVVERSIRVDAPPATVFTLLNGFRRFPQWSPWSETDPTIRYSLSGALTGPGARLDWEGDPVRTGSGSQTIMAVQPPRRIDIAFDQEDGASGANLWFALESTEDSGTRITWGYSTDLGSNIFNHLRGPLLERRVGRMLEHGLVRLQALAGRLAGMDLTGIEPEIVEQDPTPVAYIRVESRPQPDAISAALGDAYSRITRRLQAAGVEAAGPPMARLRSTTGRMRMDAAIPLPPDADFRAGDGIRVGTTPAGPVLRMIHRGPYSGIGEAHIAGRYWLQVAGLPRSGDPWEVYVSDPGTTPEPQLITYVLFPLEAGD